MVDVSYDHASGFYANGSVIAGERRGEDLTVIGAIGNIGYARRINSQVTLDAGLVHIDRLPNYAPGATGRYTEAYVGVNAGHLSARVSYSPNYLRHGLQTLYTEVNGGIDTVAKLRLNGHLGYLSCLDAAGFRCVDRVVWRVGVARPFDRLELHASLTGAAAPGGEDLRLDENPSLVVGASWTF